MVFECGFVPEDLRSAVIVPLNVKVIEVLAW